MELTTHEVVYYWINGAVYVGDEMGNKHRCVRFVGFCNWIKLLEVAKHSRKENQEIIGHDI